MPRLQWWQLQGRFVAAPPTRTLAKWTATIAASEALPAVEADEQSTPSRWRETSWDYGSILDWIPLRLARWQRAMELRRQRLAEQHWIDSRSSPAGQLIQMQFDSNVEQCRSMRWWKAREQSAPPGETVSTNSCLRCDKESQNCRRVFVCFEFELSLCHVMSHSPPHRFNLKVAKQKPSMHSSSTASHGNVHIESDSSSNAVSTFLQQVKSDFLELFTRDEKASYTSLDGLRALAVIWVIAFHQMLFVSGLVWVNPFSSKSSVLTPAQVDSVNAYLFLVSGGDLGVDIFFVLSGFLIADILIRDFAKHRVCAWSFLYRRFLRIVPAYAVTIVLYLVGATLSSTDSEACQKYWWQNLLFLNNVLVSGDIKNCVPQAWSIAVEFQFYLISPMLMLWLVSASHQDWIRAFVPRRFASSMAQSSSLQADHQLIQPLSDALDESESPLSADELAQSLANNFRYKMGGLSALGLLSLIIQAIIYIANYRDRSNPLFYFQVVYPRMWCRMIPYLAGIGMCLYYHAFGKAEAKANRLEASVDQASDQGVLSGLMSSWNRDSTALLVTVIANVVVAHFGAGDKNVWEMKPQDFFAADQLFFAFFTRVIFGCGVAYQVYLCLAGRGQLLNRFLSSKLWLPFARLSFSAYLFQFIFFGWFFTLKSQLSVLDFNSSWSGGQAYVAVLLVMLLCQLFIFVLATPVYLLIEKTFMRLR
jgi:peptidoglycan/LPS O-acetylase OafA/YrhL